MKASIIFLQYRLSNPVSKLFIMAYGSSNKNDFLARYTHWLVHVRISNIFKLFVQY